MHIVVVIPRLQPLSIGPKSGIVTEGLPHRTMSPSKTTDLLIRDVPDDVLAALESKAQRSGLSLAEFLQRMLARESSTTGAAVSVDDLDRFATSFGDLMSDAVTNDAWR